MKPIATITMDDRDDVEVVVLAPPNAAGIVRVRHGEDIFMRHATKVRPVTDEARLLLGMGDRLVLVPKPTPAPPKAKAQPWVGQKALPKPVVLPKPLTVPPVWVEPMSLEDARQRRLATCEELTRISNQFAATAKKGPTRQRLHEQNQLVTNEQRRLNEFIRVRSERLNAMSVAVDVGSEDEERQLVRAALVVLRRQAKMGSLHPDDLHVLQAIEDHLRRAVEQRPQPT